MTITNKKKNKKKNKVGVKCFPPPPSPPRRLTCPASPAAAGVGAAGQVQSTAAEAMGETRRGRARPGQLCLSLGPGERRSRSVWSMPG